MTWPEVKSRLLTQSGRLARGQMNRNLQKKSRRQALLIRAGGGALLIGFMIHIIANAVLKQFPPENPSLDELKTYLQVEAATWSVVHGLRYVAIACLAIFLGGILARIRSSSESSGGWEYVGLVGGVLLLSNLLIANSIETFAFLDFEMLSENPELFWLVFHATRVLFSAEIVAWAILIFGFSMAGWLSASLPRTVSIVGFAAAATGLTSGSFVVALLNGDGWVATIDSIGVFTSLVWFLCIGVWMLWRGAR